MYLYKEDRCSSMSVGTAYIFHVFTRLDICYETKIFY